MLTITIDLIPLGVEAWRRTIATMNISNESGTGAVCDYAVDAIESANALIGTSARITRCRVEAHCREQTVWALVEAACAAVKEADHDEL